MKASLEGMKYEVPDQTKRGKRTIGKRACMNVFGSYWSGIDPWKRGVPTLAT